MYYRLFALDLFEYQKVADQESFRVRVANSPAGEQKISAAENVHIPPDLRSQLTYLEQGLLTKTEIIDLGKTLASLMIPASVIQFYENSLAALKEQEGLRIQLRIDHLALSYIPWEYAYITPPNTIPGQETSEGFLSLNRHLSIERYEEMSRAPGSLDPIDKDNLRVVSLFANPKFYQGQILGELKLSEEEQNIREILGRVQGIHYDPYQHTTIEILENALEQGLHVFHFGGHGDFKTDIGASFGSIQGEGFLLLEGDQDQAVSFSAENLALNLKGCGARLAILGACHAGRRDEVNPWTGVAPALIRAGIPVVIGMQYTIKDPNAIAFSKRLYRALALGQPVETAVANGRLAISNGGSKDEDDWGVPILYTHIRSDQSGTILFPRPQMPESNVTWDDICKKSREQLERSIPLAATPVVRSASYDPELYVHRQTIEKQLQDFLDSLKVGLVLVGESGVGKTNLLYQWAAELSKSGQGVFLYNCGGSINSNIQDELTRDFMISDASKLETFFQEINQLAEMESSYFTIIFDGINEFQQAGNNPGDLLKQIDSLIAHLPKGSLRVVVSCNLSTWNSLSRNSSTNLYWNLYYQPVDNEQVLVLGDFSPEELQAAYLLYKTHFHLQTEFIDLSLELRERLRRPLMLRMLSEAYQNKNESIGRDSLAFGIYQVFYKQRVNQRRDKLFLDELAAEMLRRQLSILLVDDLARNDKLSDEIINEDLTSSYYHLLDLGVLTEISGDLVVGDMVKFTYPSLGAFVMAINILQRSEFQSLTPEILIEQSGKFPLAWDVAKSLLILSKNKEMFSSLAQSSNVENRELVVEALVEMYPAEPAATFEIIKQLFDLESPEANRTSLKAAYFIGPSAHDIFVYAATSRSPLLREAVKDTLYLIWRRGSLTIRQSVSDTLYAIGYHDPGFTYELLNEIADKVGWTSPFELVNLLEFIGDLSITIYINHCEQKDIIQQTTDLWYKILKTRLKLDRINITKLPSRIQDPLNQVVGKVFSKRLLETALFTELVPPDRLFSLPDAEKVRFKSVVPLVDPATDILPRCADLAYLFSSDIVLFNILAAVVLAVHSCHDFASTKTLIYDLFESLNGYGRMWELLSFATLLPDTPPEWLQHVETFTRRLILENPAVIYGEEAGFMQQFDILLVPLGLAYGKRGLEMSAFQELLVQGEVPLFKRCIRGLGAVGFYYPQAVFQTLESARIQFDDPHIQEALVPTLATIRMLHFDAVDVFLNRIKADDNFKRRVSASSDVELVRRYIYWLGIYNNAVHQALHYPKMRRQLLIGGLNALANAHRVEDFITAYTPIPIRMVWEANFRLSEWTLPD